MITNELLQIITGNIALVLGVVTALNAAAAALVNGLTNVIRIAVPMPSWAGLVTNIVIACLIAAALMMALGIYPSYEMFGIYVLLVVSIVGSAAVLHQLAKSAIRTNDARHDAAAPAVIDAGRTARLEGD